MTYFGQLYLPLSIDSFSHQTIRIVLLKSNSRLSLDLNCWPVQNILLTNWNLLANTWNCNFRWNSTIHQPNCGQVNSSVLHFIHSLNFVGGFYWPLSKPVAMIITFFGLPCFRSRNISLYYKENESAFDRWKSINTY